MKQPLIYGVTVAVCVFFVGWITGMGGSLVPNLLFSMVMGALATALFWGVARWSRRRDD